MTVVLLLAALVGWWAYRTRAWRALRFGDVAAAVAAIVAVALLRKGETLPALAALAGSGWWLWFRRGMGGAIRADPAVDAARRLLGVADDADDAAIRRAHRRLLTRLHPDAGGTDALAAQVNAARDTLLATRGG